MNWSPMLVGLVAPATVTVTSTVPPPGGLLAVHWLVLVQLTLVAATLPNLIVVAPAVVAKPEPLMVTRVPPAAGPLRGPMLETEGGVGGGGNTGLPLTAAARLP